MPSTACFVVVALNDGDGLNDAPTYDRVGESREGSPDSIVVLSIAHTEEDICPRFGHATQRIHLRVRVRGSLPTGTEVIQAACGA
ncbi:MAG: hypothetical protein ACRBN8_25610 [Nannocystales bacterium]